MGRLRGVPWWVVASVALGGCSGGDESTVPAGVGALSGHWLWYQQVEAGQVVLTIEEADLQVADWPGCPQGIICTHYGIRKFDFEPSGAVAYIYNVTTSSDFEYEGTFSVADDLVSYSFDTHFSCAHPDINDTDTRAGYFRYRAQDGNLWVSVTGFDGDLPFSSQPPDSPDRWIVFRPVTPEDYASRYMIRLCQAATDDGCHPHCFPESYGTWGP